MKFLKYTLYIIVAAATMMLAGCKTLNTPATPEQVAAHNVAVDVLKAKTFLIKADRLSVQNKFIPGALESTNFVTVMGDNAIVQVSPGMSGGPNGLGGFTVKGTATGYKFSQKENGEVRVEYHVSATAGACDLSIILNSKTADATVYINNSFRNLKATIYGQVVPIDDTFTKGYYPF